MVRGGRRHRQGPAAPPRQPDADPDRRRPAAGGPGASGGDTAVTSTMHRTATAVIIPAVMAAPVRSAIDATIIPAIPRTQVASTMRRIQRGAMRDRR